MQHDEKKELIERIRQTIAATEKEIESLKELSKPVEPDVAIGRLTRMDAIQSKSISEASLRKAEHKRETLRLALDKSDNEDFGTCVRCGNDIQIGRLMFLPESTLCITCASR